jgi:hypothetical protein
MTWAQSIANEKLSIFAEATRVAKARRDAVGEPELSVLLVESASKVGEVGYTYVSLRAMASADELGGFLAAAGLQPGVCWRASALFSTTRTSTQSRCYANAGPR